MVAAFTYLIKNPSSLQQYPKTHSPTDSLFKIAQMFFEHIYYKHPWMSASAKCISQNYTDSSIILCLWCSVLRKQLRSSNKLKRFNGAPKKIFGSKNSHHNQKSTHYEEKKTINLRMFLCVLIGKKRLTAQSIQKSIIWCPISIKNKFLCFETGERSLIDLTLQDVIFFYF